MAIPMFSKLQKYVVIIMVAFGALIAYWMMAGGGSGGTKTPVTKSLFNVKKLSVACRAYAAGHGGAFPPSLDALVPGYLADRSALVSPLMPDEPEGYQYTPGLKATGPVNAVLVEDKFAPLQHIRIVAYVDDSARVLQMP